MTRATLSNSHGAVRWWWAAVALAVAAAGATLTLRYPVLPGVAFAVWITWTVACYRFPLLWVGVVPALMPALGFASWTGWLIFEELDLLLAGVVAAGYARFAFAGAIQADVGSPPDALAPFRVPLASVVLLSAFFITSVIGVIRGVLDAGAIDLGLTQGYFGTLNSVRLFKPYAWALLLCPLLIAAMRRSATRLAMALGWGLTVGLGIVALGALWERAAFTDILNFSSDYRTTSLFWEMHVGGAALDGYLALAFPFALWLAWDARGRLAHGAAVAIVLLASYAALTTFSRGVFAALPIGVLVWIVLRLRQNPGVNDGIGMRAALAAAGFVVVSGFVAWAVFQHGGYRGLIAILMAFGAIVLVLPAMRFLPLSILTLALLSGLLGALLIWALDSLISKGPYVLHGLLFCLCVTTAMVGKQVLERGRAFVLAGAAFALAFSAINVSLHWGGATNSALAVGAGCVVALAGFWASRSALGEPLAVRRNQLRLGAGVVVVGAVVSVFSGGAPGSLDRCRHRRN